MNTHYLHRILVDIHTCVCSSRLVKHEIYRALGKQKLAL